ncbi:alpha-E domain-containing protein [Candidatus Poriferisocius sp.]|uniref:alpha-E domain-containing protein n=1 Tax=Candidatus Poriferisocius sp. TaxID=3101276 RepID=UPI003B0237DF
MLARHAEDMFWAGRYLERAEDTARMVRATLLSTVAESPAQAIDRMQNLTRTLRLEEPAPTEDVQSMAEQLAMSPPMLRSEAGLGIDVQAEATRLVTSPALAGSVVFCVGCARENFRTLRDQIPSELWEQINQFHLRLRRDDFSVAMDNDPFPTLDLIQANCQTMTGVISSSMSQDESYRFLVLGQMLERALMTCRLVSVRYPELDGSSYDEMALTLRSVSALEAYQRAGQSSPLGADVARFLLVNELFPRSVLHCLLVSENQVAALVPHEKPPPLRRLGQLRSELEYADFADMVADLPSHLTAIEAGVREVAELVGGHFFRKGEALDLHAQAIKPGAPIKQGAPIKPGGPL